MSETTDKTADEIVDEILAKGGGAVPITFTATYAGYMPKVADDGQWEHDSWAVMFRLPNKLIAFPYRTGIGCRAEPTKQARMEAKYRFPGLLKTDIERRTIYGRKYLAHLETLRKPGFADSKHIPFTKQYRVRCHSCEALVINGTPCHETGCSEAMHECNGCNAIIPVRQRYCEDCE